MKVVLFVLGVFLMVTRTSWSQEEYRAVPKAELHLHLGGAFPVDFLRTLATEKDFAALEEGLDWIAGRVPYEEGFQVFNLIGKIVNTEEKLEAGTAAVCRELAKDGVVYAEIRTSLKDLGQGYEEYLRAVVRGIEKGKSDRFQAKILLSLWRFSSYEQAKRTVDLALKYKEVVGIDLSGDSTLGTVETILPELLRAKENGLYLTLHLGESPKELNQRQLLEILKPDRIGHGIFLSEEAKQWIWEKRIPIEMCLSSGYLVQMIEDYSSHPALEYFLRGHPVSLCTDDPLVFRTTLTKECRLLNEKVGFSPEQTLQMIEKTFEQAFLSSEEKGKILYKEVN